MKFYLLFFSIVMCTLSCKTGSQSKSPKSSVVNVLDSLDAANEIVEDYQTDFFKNINNLDMSIQTKTDLSDMPKSEALTFYKNYLRKDVESFTKEEKIGLEKLFVEIKKECDQLSTDIFPKNLKLVKTKSKHYGKGIFYTRNEAIVIPNESLTDIESPGFKGTMVHELFHIYSRLHPAKQAKLYQLIGFKKVAKSNELAMVNSLKDKILLNPDGVNFAVKIQLKTDKNEYVDAFPIIFSNQKKFNTRKTNFFEYLTFDLFEVKGNSGRFEVISDAKGNSTLPPEFMNSFFNQIKDNTQYTIHPDEIMADNFMLLMQWRASKESKAGFSKKGEQLILQVEQIISK